MPGPGGRHRRAAPLQAETLALPPLALLLPLQLLGFLNWSELLAGVLGNVLASLQLDFGLRFHPLELLVGALLSLGELLPHRFDPHALLLFGEVGAELFAGRVGELEIGKAAFGEVALGDTERLPALLGSIARERGVTLSPSVCILGALQLRL